MRGAAADAWAVTGRNLLGYLRTPQLLIFSSIQPVIFVLLFRYVFGGATPSARRGGARRLGP